MEFHEMTFFCDKGRGVKANFDFSAKEVFWPGYLELNIQGSKHKRPAIVIYFATEQDLITLKNSVIESYETMLRKRKEEKENA